jgi:hypothetical protein
VLEVRQPENFERAFTAMSRERAGALLVIADGMFILQRTRIVDLAAKAHLPAMYTLREHMLLFGEAQLHRTHPPHLRSGSARRVAASSPISQDGALSIDRAGGSVIESPSKRGGATA